MKKLTEVPEVQLTPELAGKIFKSLQKEMYDAEVSKNAVLHHLKQLKAQMGKAKKEHGDYNRADYLKGIWKVEEMIDKKIAKIEAL